MDYREITMTKLFYLITLVIYLIFLLSTAISILGLTLFMIFDSEFRMGLSSIFKKLTE